MFGRQEKDAKQWAELDAGDTVLFTDGGRIQTSYGTVRLQKIDAERQAIIQLRDRGRIGDDVLRRIQHDLDLETMLLGTERDELPESPDQR